MLDELKAISSTKKDLINFAQVMTIACVIIGGIMYWREKENWIYFAVAAGVFLVFRLVWPMGLVPLQKVWMALAVMMGWVVSRVILSVLFFVGFVGIGVPGRIFGKGFLDLKIDKDADSYWIKRPKEAFDPTRCEKQF